MASNDTFDLLDQLGDKSKVEKLKAKIEKHKGVDVLGKLDKIEAEIDKAVSDKRSSEDIVQGIIQANFKTLNSDVESTEKDLQELMLHLRAMLDSCGGEFAKLQELGPEEQKLVDNAMARLEEAKKDVSRAEGMSDLANILFGMKNRRIRKSKKDLAESEQKFKNAEIDANRMYRDRLKNADIGDSLNRIISQVQGMVSIIEGMIVDVETQIEALKTRKEIAFETKEKAARVMEERQAELDDLEGRLRAAETELEEMENSTPEHTEQQKLIADMREQRAELKGKYNIALGIFQSKERFVDQIVVHLEAQTTTKNNLKQLIGQLRSDTEERMATYESGLQLIQSATAQEAASIYEDAGTKTDQQITEIAAKIFVSSEEDRIERIKKHPDRMAELHRVLVAMAQATAKYKEEDEKLAVEHKRKYGIDTSAEYSWKYQKEGGSEPAGSGNEGSESSDVSSLMD